MKTIDKIGKKFGRWTVLEIVQMGKKPIVKCICDCGTIKNVVSGQLTNTPGLRGSSSCGCYQKERVSKSLYLGKDVSALNQYYSVYKTSAKKRNVNFELDKKQFSEFIFNTCYYCNQSPSPRKINSLNTYINVNGIDRVDNELGYIVSNCVSCCKKCNTIKHSITKDMVKKIYERLFLNA